MTAVNPGIAVSQVQTYTTNIQMLLQQFGSRFTEAVTVQGCYGKAAAFVEQFASVNPVMGLGRHADTPLIDVAQDRRWLYPNDIEFATLLDTQDQLRQLIDPKGSLAQAGANALNRGKDDAILAGFFGSNKTGENGSTDTGTLSAYGSGSQVIAATVGSGSTNSGLNVAKLRAAKKLLMEAEVDVDTDPLFMGISARQHDDLLNEAQAINTDYTNRPVLVDGRLMRFMGFNFIHSERIPGAANFNTTFTGNSAITGYTTGTTWLVPFWAKSGVTLGVFEDVNTQVAQRADKRMAWQVYTKMTVGASRNEEKRCGIITCY